MWTIWLKVGEPAFTSITASASGFEESGLSISVYAKFSGGASIASFGDAWKVGSGLIVIECLAIVIEAHSDLLSVALVCTCVQQAGRRQSRCQFALVGPSALSLWQLFDHATPAVGDPEGASAPQIICKEGFRGAEVGSARPVRSDRRHSGPASDIVNLSRMSRLRH